MNMWVRYTQMLYILLGQNHVQNVFSTLHAMDEVIIISGGFSGGKKFHHGEKLHSVAPKHLVLSKNKLPHLIFGAFLNQAPTRIFLVLPHTTLIQLI